jgi:hypothetical protein
MAWWLWASWAMAGAAGAGAAALGYFALLHDPRRGMRRCPRCWYDMEAVPGLVCPECGRAARRERALHKRRRRWGLAAAAAMLGVAAYAGWLVQRMARSGWAAELPTPALLAVIQVWDDSERTGFEEAAGRRLAGWWPAQEWEARLMARACARVLQRADPAPAASPGSASSFTYGGG